VINFYRLLANGLVIWEVEAVHVVACSDARGYKYKYQYWYCAEMRLLVLVLVYAVHIRQVFVRWCILEYLFFP